MQRLTVVQSKNSNRSDSDNSTKKYNFLNLRILSMVENILIGGKCNLKGKLRKQRQSPRHIKRNVSAKDVAKENKEWLKLKEAEKM